MIGSRSPIGRPAPCALSTIRKALDHQPFSIRRPSAAAVNRTGSNDPLHGRPRPTREKGRDGAAFAGGAPNLARGGSHSGNVAAQELAELDLLDILSSDYVPSALLLATGAFAKPAINTIGSPGLAIKGYDPVAYFKQARKKLSKLKRATELFVEIQPEVSGHTNFQMAAHSLTDAVNKIDVLLNEEGV